MDIHGTFVDMDMDMDEKFHIYRKSANITCSNVISLCKTLN